MRFWSISGNSIKHQQSWGRTVGKAGVRLGLILMSGFCGAVGAAADYSLDWGPGFDIRWKNKLAMGAQMRLEAPDRSFIGKTNLDPELCAVDSCISLNRDDLEPHQRWMAAPGGNWQIADDANLIHDQWDLTSAVLRWRSGMSIVAGDGTWGAELDWQAFYDPYFDNLDYSHPNIVVQQGPAPGVARDIDLPPHARDEMGRAFDLRTAYVYFRLPYWDDRRLDVRIGRQHLGWGEALFTISGTLNFVNPLNLNNLFRPSMDLDEILDPVGMISLATEMTPKLSAELFYQLEWRPYVFPTRGSLGSFIVDIGGQPENRGSITDDSLPLPFGKTPEDPLQQQRALTPVVGLISDTAGSIPRLNNREPDSTGQYGIKLSYFEEGWLGGTELSAYFANYHARLPAASFIAADATCAAAEGSATGMDAQAAPFPLGLINFLIACGRDVASIPDLLADLAADNPRLVGEGYDALPISSARIFLEFPENIQVFGLGVNTSALGLIWTGELAYRPDHPFQVDLEDVFFTALQPVFPRNELPLFPAAAAALDPVLAPLAAVLGLPLDQLAGATFTDRRNAIADYLTEYRGGTPGEVAPGAYVRGYEAFDYWLASVGVTKVLGRQGSAWIRADQTALLLEFSAAYVPDLPGLDELQLDSLATTNTHYSPGIEETGDALRINPFSQPGKGFPRDFSWGYKAAAIWAYNDVWLQGLRVRPQMILFHDVYGTSPGLGGNFQHGRKIALTGVNFNYQNRYNFSVDYFGFFGGGSGNRLRDRDFLNVSASYSF